MLKIITNPHPLLRQKARPVADILSAENQLLSRKMAETMLLADGVGLAAPQVGKSLRLIAVNHQNEVLIMFNPRLFKKSLLKEWGEEGCLSVPDKYGEVKRHKKISVEFQDRNGKIRSLVARGLLARVIQHEVDHLDGILFIDKVRNLQNIN